MKKRLALVLSIVLALSVAICLLVLPASADPAEGYFDAEAEANTIWASAENKVYTVYYNGVPMHNTKEETSLADLGIGFTGGTYTLDNGVLTFYNAEVADPSLRITAKGSLKVVINGKDLYASVENDYAPYGDLLITSETGNKIITGTKLNSIRSSGNLVIYGNVGFEVVHEGGDDQIVIDDSGPSASVRMILAPEVDSIISGYGSRNIRNSRSGNVYLGGSANVTIANGYEGQNFLTGGGDVCFLGSGNWTVSSYSAVQMTTVGGANSISAYEDVTVSIANLGSSAAFNPSYTPTFHAYGNAEVTITTQSNVTGGNTAIIDGNAKVSLIGTTSITYGGTLTIGGSADVTLTTTDSSGAGAIYDAKTTISGDAKVTINGAGNAVRDNKHNDAGGLVLSDNAKLTVNSGIYAFNQTPVTASGNVQIIVTGQDRAFSDSPLTLSGNAQVTVSANGNNAISSSPLTATGNAKVTVTAAHHAFVESAVSLSGTAVLDVTATEYVFLYGNVSLGGNSKTTVSTVSAPTYGAGGYTFDVFENAKLSIETEGGDVLYNYVATFKDDSQVSLKAGNGSVCWNSSVDILGNAIVDMHTDGFSGDMIHGSGGQSLFVEDNATLNISGVTGNVVSMNYGRSDRNYIGFSMSDSAKVNVNVNASHIFYMNDYAGINISGGKLDVRGTVSLSVFNSRTSSAVNLSGGTVDMQVPDARAFFEAANADTYFTIGANAKVSGIAKQLFCAFGDGASYLTFDPITNGAPTNVMLVGTNGTSCVGNESYAGHFMSTNLDTSAGVPRLFTNWAARDTSSSVIARITDANGTTEITEESTSYNTEYGSATFDTTTRALYVSNLNIIKLETLVSCNLIVSGENRIINTGDRALYSADGKSMIIYGLENSTLTLQAASHTIYADKLTTLGGLTLNAISTSGFVMEPNGSLSYGDYLIANKELNVTAAGNYSFCKYKGSGDLAFKNSRVTISGGKSVVRTEGSGNVYFDNCNVNVTATSAEWPIRCDSGNIYVNNTTLVVNGITEGMTTGSGSIFIKDSTVTSTTPAYYPIYGAASVEIDNSTVTTESGSNGIVSPGNIVIKNGSVVTVDTAGSDSIKADGAILISGSQVNATSNSEKALKASTLTVTDGAKVTVSAATQMATSISGNVTVSDSEFTSSTAGQQGFYTSGNLMVTNSKFTGITRESYYGIYAANVIATDSTIVAQGGSSNALTTPGELTLKNSTLTVNCNGGNAVNVTGSILLKDSTANVTASAYSFQSGSGNITIDDSVLTLNVGSSEGGITASNGTITIQGSNTTVTSNSGYYALLARNIVIKDQAKVYASTTGSLCVKATGDLSVTNGAYVEVTCGTHSALTADGNINIAASTVEATGTTSVLKGVAIGISDSIVTAEGTGDVVVASGNLTIENGSSVDASSTGAYALYAYGSILVDASEVTAHADGGTAFRKYADGAGDFIIRNGSTVTATSNDRYALVVDAGDLYITNSTVTATAATYGAISAGVEYGGDSSRSVYIKNSTVTAEAAEARTVFATGDISIDGSTVTATGTVTPINAEAGPVPIKNSTVSVTGTYEVLKPAYIQGSTVTVTSTGANEDGEALALTADALSITDGSDVTVTATAKKAMILSGALNIDNSALTVSTDEEMGLNALTLSVSNGSDVNVSAGTQMATVISGVVNVSDSKLYSSTVGQQGFFTHAALTITNSEFSGISTGSYYGIYAANVTATGSTVTAQGGSSNALATPGVLTLKNSTLTASAPGSVVMPDQVLAQDSTINVTSGSIYAIKATSLTFSNTDLTASGTGELVVAAGNLTIENGSNVNVTATDTYAMYANGTIIVDASEVTVTSTGHSAFRKYGSNSGDFIIRNGSTVSTTSETSYYALVADNGNLIISDSSVTAKSVTAHAIIVGNENSDGSKNITIENSIINAQTDGYYAIRASGSLSIRESSDVYAKSGTSWTVSTANGNISIDASKVDVDCTTSNGLATEGGGSISITGGSNVDVSGQSYVLKASGSLSIESSVVVATGTVAGNALAIDAAGTLSITNGSNVTATATNGDYAIQSTGLLTVDDSTLTATTATGNAIRAKAGAEVENGSAVTLTSGTGNAFNISGDLKVDNSTLNANGGGDVVVAQGEIKILNNSNVSVIAEGSYPLYNYANFTIDNSTVTAISNTAHRALTMFNNGTLTINKSVVNVESTYFGITTDNGNIVITDSVVNSTTPEQGAIFAGVGGSTGNLTITDSKVTAATNGYYAIRTAQDLVINGSDVTATTGTSYTVTSIGGNISATDSKITINCGTAPALETTNGSVTFTHSDVTSTTINVITAGNNANIKVNNGALTVDGGTVRVNSSFTTFSVGEDDSQSNYYGAGIMVNNGTLNVLGGDLIVDTTSNDGAVGTSILLNYSTLNVGGGEKKAGLAVYNKGSSSGYAGGSAAAILMYPGTMNVMNNGRVYLTHESYIGIYMLTREGMADSWNTDAGLRVSGGQVEVYSAGSNKIPFGQGKSTNGADKTTFSANYKYTGGVVLAHTSYPGYVYDTTFLSDSKVENAFFVGSVGRTLTGGSVNTNLGEHASFDRAGDLPSQDWIYWANGAEYQYYNPLNQGNGVLVSYDGEAKWAFKAPMMTSAENTYAQYFINEDVYELKKDQTVALTNNPVIRLTSGQAAYASFDVQWAAMNFVYESGAWIPSTHTYESEGWVHKTGDEVTDATVKVTNRGTTAIETTLAYTPNSGYENFAVSIDKSGEEEISVGGEIVYTVNLNADKPSQAMDSVAVGTLKLTVIMPGAAAVPETPVTPVVPNDPTAPGTPAAPGTPGTPATPNIPSIPADPDEPEEPEVKSFDSSISHAFFATANSYSSNGAGIYLFNVTSSGLVELGNWSWKASDYGSSNSTVFRALTAAKLRVHPTYGNVVIATSTDGWVGVIKYGTEGDYTDKTLIFESTGFSGAHDAEMLPNGDLVVLSTASKLYYFNFSTSTKTYTQTETLTLKNVSSENSDGHGVMWDPTLDCLWVLHDYYIAKIIVENYGTSNVTLRYDAELHFMALGDDGQYHYVESAAHSFCPAYGEPGKYYFSGHYNTWIFDSKTMTFEKAADAYQCGDKGENCGTASTTEGKLKGIAYFEDGTMVAVPMDYNSSSNGWFEPDWDAGGLHVTLYENGVLTHKKVPMSGYEFYKVFPVNADYQ